MIGGFLMSTKLAVVLLLTITINATATELRHQFNSPSFSGQGWSQHVLTIEQLEHQRRQRIKDDEKAAEEKAERDWCYTGQH